MSPAVRSTTFWLAPLVLVTAGVFAWVTKDQPTLKETLTQDLHLNVKSLRVTPQEIALSFSREPDDGRIHEYLLCGPKAPGGCEDTHKDFRSNAQIPGIDRITVGGSLHPEDQKEAEKIRALALQSKRPHGLKRLMEAVIHFRIGEHS